MITLYCGGENFGLPEVSPYVTKTEVQLKMANLPYRKERAIPPQGPKGQLPFINDDGAMIGDSTFIRAHIERKYGVDLDEGLDARQRAEAWAIERMLENHFCYTAIFTRWMMDENFEKGPAHFFDQAPEEMRAKVRDEARSRVAAAYMAQGTARHSPDEIVELGTRSLNALSALMGDKPYLMGAKPCGTDATAFAMLAGLLTPFFESPLRRKAEGYASLVAYTDRMMRQYYPEHPWKAA